MAMRPLKDRGKVIRVSLGYVQWLKDESEYEGEEEEGSGSVPRVRAGTKFQGTTGPERAETTIPRHDDPAPEKTEDAYPRGGKATKEAVDVDAKIRLEAPQKTCDSLKDPLGAI